MRAMVWVLLALLFASGLSLERYQIAKPVLDGNIALADLQASFQLAGSNFELESDANIKVDSPSPSALDFANAPATQFFPDAPSNSLVVTGFYRELVPANNGVYFYIYWIAQQARQPITVEFRQSQGSRTPLDVRLYFNTLINTVVLDIWTCFPVGSSNCSFTSPSGTSWNMAPNVAYFSYNVGTIPGPETSLPPSASAPAWFASQQATWAASGIPAGYYGKGGVDLKKLPCYAGQDCADWSWIAIIPAGSSVPISVVPFENGYCSHINIQKSTASGANLSGATFGLYQPLGNANQFQKGGKIGNCTTDRSGKCSIKAPVGTFIFFEDRAPPGFIPISPRVVTISSLGTMLSYPLRDKSGDSTGLKIQKVSGETGALVAGASFIIRQTLDNGTVIQFQITSAPSTFCTDYQQPFPVQFLWDDNLCVQVDIIETTPPIGFLPITLANTTWCAVPDEDKQNCTSRPVLRVTDQPTPYIVITKVGNGVLPITGTVLGLSPSGDPNQNYSAIPSYARCTITSGTTSCRIKAPTLGSYYAVEISPPTGYTRAAPQGPLNIVANGVYTITITDYVQLYGAPTIARLDCYGSAVNMAGGSYQVCSNGVCYNFAGADGYFRTCFNNGTNLFPLGPDGCAPFTITELTPPINQIPALNQTLTVYYCGGSVPDCSERPIDGNFVSPVCTGSLVIHKTGDSTTGTGSVPLDGVVYRLSSNGGTSYSVDATSQGGGIVCFDDVPIGSYVLREISTLPGYVLDTGTHVVSITATDSFNSCDHPSNQLDFYNYRFTGSFKIAKMKEPTYYGYQGSSSYLSGARFLVRRVGSTWSTTITIGSTGVECVQVDSIGTFTVEEVSPPPGYLISAPSQKNITVTQSYTCANTPYLLTFYDQQPSSPPPTTCAPATSTGAPASTVGYSGGGTTCGLQISVYGQASYAGGEQSPLAGATLQVQGADGRTQVLSMTSDSVCVNVAVGSYTITQIAPPQSTSWTPSTTFPIYGECTSQNTCPNQGSSQSILYTS